MSRHILASLHIGFDRPMKGLAWKTKSLVLLALNQEVAATLEPDGGKRLFEHMNELGFASTEKVEGEELLLAIHVAIQNSDGCVPFCVMKSIRNQLTVTAEDAGSSHFVPAIHSQINSKQFQFLCLSLLCVWPRIAF